ncbi:MAG: two pore domain potassium channel family protein, partial [Chloroflexi bacterium]|nr:two pore domain potassium channel family protein [Chloroflexota bacterium]
MVLIAVLRSMAANVLGRIVAVAVVLGAVGVAGYMIIEGWSFLDAAFMTVLTFTTVGYQEVHPLSDGGKIFSIFFMITVLGVFMFGFTTVARTVVEEGAFRSMVHRRRMV